MLRRLIVSIVPSSQVSMSATLSWSRDRGSRRRAGVLASRRVGLAAQERMPRRPRRRREAGRSRRACPPEPRRRTRSKAEPTLAIWTLVVFLAACWRFSTKFAWKPLLHALHEREKHLEHVLHETERARNESESS